MGTDHHDSHRHGLRADDALPQRLAVPADAAQLGGVRSWVVELAREHDATDDVVEAIELAVSELATNVIRHTPAERIVVGLDRDEADWILDVSDADQLGALPPPTPPDPDELTGRGLFIVQSVMDDVELVDLDGHTHIRCRRRA